MALFCALNASGAKLTSACVTRTVNGTGHESSPSTSASFFSSGAVDIVQRYAFFNFLALAQIGFNAPKPPTEFRFPLPRFAPNVAGPRASPLFPEMSAPAKLLKRI